MLNPAAPKANSALEEFGREPCSPRAKLLQRRARHRSGAHLVSSNAPGNKCSSLALPPITPKRCRPLWEARKRGVEVHLFRGQTRNIEVGVLLDDAELAQHLSHQFPPGPSFSALV